ncbi:MAG: PEP-CTERM sorting domain-containing protein [Proteobacteria bacterium]|nr:PEP-CTERM sorting domain-containing protein [Pseudomonadota bacterium]
MTGSVLDSAGTHGFVRDAAGNYTLFDNGSTGFTQGRSISDNGTAVGYSEPAPGGDSHGRTEFVRAPDGTLTQLVNPNTSAPLAGIAQGINSSGAIVGDYLTGPGTQIDGFILNGSTFTDLSVAGDNVRARGITDSGEVAGWVSNAGGSQGFILLGGVYSFFSAPGSFQSTFFEDINANGLVAGEYNDAGGVSHGFVFDSNTDTFTDIDVPGATNVNAFGINDAGQVVLNTFNADGVVTNYLYDPNGGVPEPATWALMIAGFGLAGAALRRRRTLAAA